MKKYKICVYAISKNEEQFVDRFMNSVKEADAVYVLDTGSTDKTVKKLKDRGAIVRKQKITPWRFDVARNLSLQMVPEDADICVCLDLDEVLDKGWRKKLENLWEQSTTRLRYNYNWSFDENGTPTVNFYIEKIHIRDHYQWTHPVHEILTYTGNQEIFQTTDEITVNHYPDPTKSRGDYLALLELSVKEQPEDDRNMHYLGREYMYYGRWNECIDTLIKHLNLKNANWKDERSASMRFIARSYQALHRTREAKMWYDLAIQEAPYLRDPYVERALFEYREGNFKEVETYAKQALKITTHEKTYINETFSWNETVYDLLSLSCFYQGKVEEALQWVEKAIEMAPKDERLQKNKEIMEEIKKEKEQKKES